MYIDELGMYKGKGGMYMVFTGSEVAELIGKDKSTLSRWRKALSKRGVQFEQRDGEYVYTEETYRIICDLANALELKEIKNLDEAITHVLYQITEDAPYVQETLPQDEPVTNAVVLNEVQKGFIEMQNYMANSSIENEEQLHDIHATVNALFDKMSEFDRRLFIIEQTTNATHEIAATTQTDIAITYKNLLNKKKRSVFNYIFPF